jgi:hypothetical protein
VRETVAVDSGTQPRARRSPEFEADLVRLREGVNRLQDSMTSPTNWLYNRLEPRIVGVPWQQAHSVRQAILDAVVTFGVYLIAPVVATSVTWSWADAPVWTWVGVAALFGAFGLVSRRLAGESAVGLAGLLALPAAIASDSDLHELVDTVWQSWRRRFYAPPAAALTVGILVASVARDGEAFRALPVGTLVMLALLVYEFTEAMVAVLLSVRLFTVEAQFTHRLSWLNPLASPPVQATLHTWFAGFGPGSPLVVLYGLAVTILIAPLSLDLLVVPLGGIALVGLVLVFASLVSLRRSVQGIVQHAKDATLETLRDRIESFEPRTRDLTTDESQRLRALLATYAAVREAPTGPTSAQTFVHAVTALAVPALTFLLAVMSEVYAERLLDQLLP